MIPVAEANEALAPVLGDVKVTRPFCTGSPKPLATETANGAKLPLTATVWLFPLTIEMVKPRDSKAPMSL
jgi:hypothetical protein